MQARRRLRCALVLALTAIGCSSPERPVAQSSEAAPIVEATASAAPEAPKPDPARLVDVTYHPANDSWEVQWRFSEPAAKILFDRRKSAKRNGVWTAGEGLRWVVEGSNELLVPIDAKPTKVFSARFATNDEQLGRSPPQNIRFTDGGRLLFTSQLGVHAIACENNGRCDRRDVGGARVWRFHTDTDWSLRVLGSAAKGQLEWAEPAGDLRGTYLYVGKLDPVANDGVRFLVDPAIPTWLADETKRRVPALLKFYAEKTAIKPDFEPMVFVSRSRTGEAIGDVNGRVLPGLLQLEAIGQKWDTASGQLKGQWFELVAHESFHLWNAQLARRDENAANEWLSEGSAVYAGSEALLSEGLVDQKSNDRHIVSSSNRCMANLKGPIFDEGAAASFYSCGAVVQFLIDRKLAKSGGAFGLLAATFAQAKTRGSYCTKDYLALLEERAADPVFVRDLRTWIEKGFAEDRAVFLQRMLKGAGLSTSIIPPKKGTNDAPTLRLD
ncbi:MAG: hypothetical protein HOW73_27655 [Polyangiaceae bacterium]|nr:hypothetical protein [Polyangiaceae bacterium]